MPVETTELTAAIIITVAVPFLLEQLKPLLKAFAVFRSDDAPWPLLASLLSVAGFVALYYAGELPSAANALEAALAGFVAAVLSRRGYDVSTATEKRVKATRDALRTAGERVQRYDGVVVEEG